LRSRSRSGHSGIKGNRSVVGLSKNGQKTGTGPDFKALTSQGPFRSGKLAYGCSRKISQGTSPFFDFVTTLQNARNALALSGMGFFINDSILKNHLFFCHPILSLHVRSIPNFKYSEMKVDALIGIMGSTWDSMVVENIVHPSLTSNSAHAASTPCLFLSDSECEKLKLAGGCFWCQ
jgi:hypothetical protein